MGMDLGSKPGQVKSDINVTPLVDVMLVLLIIFMVITPMLQKGQAVKLPVASNPAKEAEEKTDVLVVVSATKAPPYDVDKIFIDKEQYTPAQFPAKIKEAFDRNPNSRLMVKADAKLSYGAVKKVMNDVQLVGFKSVGLIAQKRETG